MYRNRYLMLLLTAAALLFTACGKQAESTTSEPLVSLTEAEPTSGTTAAATSQPPTGTEPASGTESVTAPETEPETEPETAPESTEPPTEPGDQPPQLLHEHTESGYYVSVELGDHRDLSELLSYGDDHDAHPVMTWEGSFNPDEPGEYPITVTLTDDAGHVAQYDVRVCVPWEKISAAIAFESILAQNEGKSCGIDVSKWQGDIDFAAVRDAGVDFVLMRIGYGEGSGEADPCFAQNFAGAQAAGLERGVYFYSTAATPDAARRQADWIAAQLDGAALDLPVAYDWENFSQFQAWGMSFDTLNAIYDAFSEQMAEYGYDTMLYAEPQTLGTAWYLPGKTIWLADYGVETDYTGTYAMRQCCNTGRIPGIDGAVDVNIRQ